MSQYFGFTNPITPHYADVPYTAYPAKVYHSVRSYTSDCARSFQLPPIVATGTGYSFSSQAEAESIALANAQEKALQLRALNPCPN